MPVERIWVIDDDIDQHQLVRVATRMAQIPVQLEFFVQASEAILRLQSLQTHFPGLIVSDLKLPVMTGLEFLDWLRASPFAVIPVIIRSNSLLQQDINAAYEHGANAYLLKGADLDTIQDNLRTLVKFWNHMCTPDISEPSGAA